MSNTRSNRMLTWVQVRVRQVVTVGVSLQQINVSQCNVPKSDLNKYVRCFRLF